MPEKYALFVGINQHPENSGLTPLKYAEADARKLAEVFEKKAGFTTRLLTGNDATRYAIEESLDSCGHGDLFLFFFSEHGQLIKGQYHLHPIDSRSGGLRALAFEHLYRQWQHQFGYEKVFAIIDACRSEMSGIKGGKGLESTAAKDIRALTHGERWVEILYGCTEGQVSYEDSDLGHGILTHSLLNVFSESHSQLSSRVLCGSAAEKMRDWCRKDPQCRLQTPWVYGRPSAVDRIILFNEEQTREKPESPEIEIEDFLLCGSLAVTCNVGGADITIGSTAFKSQKGSGRILKNLPVGIYSVSVSKPGYKDFQTRVEVEENVQAGLRIKLEIIAEKKQKKIPAKKDSADIFVEKDTRRQNTSKTRQRKGRKKFIPIGLLIIFCIIIATVIANQNIKPREIKRDGRSILFDNDVVFDTETNLEWVAGPDKNTDWDEAKEWVEGLDIAGGGWRMPTRKELDGLYQKGKGSRNMTSLLKMTGFFVWSGETKGSSSALYFFFGNGFEYWGYRDNSYLYRAFAVRSRR